MRFFIVLVCLLMTHTVFGQETITRIAGGTSEINAVQVNSGPLAFDSNKIYYVHSGALVGVTQLTLNNLHNTEIHFLASFKGSNLYWVTYGDDSGILNVVDCDNLKITGLDVENTRSFKSGNIVLETSVTVNVSRSNVTFEHCNITSNAKCALLVHSGSRVGLYDSTVSACYFEVTVGASTLIAERCVFNQDSPIPDSHSAIWVSSSMRNGVTNTLYENTDVVLEDVTFNMEDGRSIVSGNGSYTTTSNVTLVRPVFNFTDPLHGIVPWHANYNSIMVVLDEVSIPNLVDYVSVPNSGFGRFVNYYMTPTTPGGPNGESPIIIDGVSSVSIAP